MSFSQIMWPKHERSVEKIKNERLAWYECMDCGQRIADYLKPKMLEDGHWVPKDCEIDRNGHVSEEEVKSKHRGFWINSLYSPWLTWSDIAAEFLKSKDFIELLMNFVNSWLAEVWEEKIEETTVNRVWSLSCDYAEGFVPDEAVVLTAGVDVQKNHFYYVIRAWGYEEQSWLIRHAQVEYWEDIVEALFKTEYSKISGEETLPVYMTCIDSGYRTDEVYQFCRKWHDRAKAIKGQEELRDGRYYRASKIDINSRTGAMIKNGLVLWNLSVNQYKDKINRLVSSKDPVKWHIFKDPSEDYLTQFTAEHKILVRNRNTGKAKEVWQKKTSSAANHYLDTEVYALAAADIIRALNLRRDDRKVFQEIKEEHSRSNWIRRREGSWI